MGWVLAIVYRTIAAHLINKADVRAPAERHAALRRVEAFHATCHLYNDYPDAMGMIPGQGNGWADGCAKRGSGGKEAGSAR